MTPERYRELELEALRCYDRLRHHAPRDAEIVYVVSRSVMRYMQGIEHNVGFEVRNGNGIVTNFRGVRMFVAPPEITDDLLLPAGSGLRFFTGMEIGDLVIDENESIYVLTRVETELGGGPSAYFTKLEYEYAMREAGVNEMVLGAPWDTEYKERFLNLWSYAFDFALSPGTDFLPFNYEDEIRRAIKQSIRDSLQIARSVQKKDEDELSPGDTKLLDDYLHSFMQPGA